MNILKIIFGRKKIVADVDPIDNTLTEREIKIVRLVVVGKRNREIATMLGVSENVVKARLQTIFEKTEVPDRLELSFYAHRHRLIPDV